MAADFSGCCEFSGAYGRFNYFESGKFGVDFDFTGNSSERIYGKDPTEASDITKAAFFLDYFRLSCTSGGSYLTLTDGSAGAKMLQLYCNTDVGGREEWDFADDPLVCLTAENTQSLCISATQNGFVTGYIKGHWGTA